MVDIFFPVDLFIKSLKIGSVLYFKHPKFPEKNHFFIVLNIDDNQKSLYLVVPTSQVKKLKQLLKESPSNDSNTFLFLENNDYSDFTKPTCINCNKLREEPIELIEKKYLERDIELKKDMPKSILIQIIKGCILSKTIKRGKKKILSEILLELE